MSLLVKGGITKLSELEIDADKDWLAQGITNIKEIAASMAKGDLAVRGNTVLVKFPPSSIGLVLTSAGPGHMLTWMPGAALEFYLPVPIELTHAEAIVTVDQSHNEDAPIATSHVQNYLDDVAHYIKRLTPAILCPDAEAIVAADQSHNKNAPVASECAIEFAVGGAILEEFGVGNTDYTTEINNVGANDVQLLPTTVAGLTENDAFYFGLDKKWGQLWLDIGVPAVGNFALAHEYWDGGAWVGLAGVVDNTVEFGAAGKHNIKWTVPGDWALTVVDAKNLFWVRARVTNAVTYTTQPLGTQGWCEVIA
ncbi:hypothetical protein ES707_13990 [subsurface metagenome]